MKTLEEIQEIIDRYMPEPRGDPSRERFKIMSWNHAAALAYLDVIAMTPPERQDEISDKYLMHIESLRPYAKNDPLKALIVTTEVIYEEVNK